MRSFQLLLRVVLVVGLGGSCWSNEVDSILEEYLPEENSPHVTCECGLTNGRMDSRIIGGEVVTYDKYQFIAALINLEDCDSECLRARCGAVIIGENHVLTAAHCVSEESVDHDKYFVAAGISSLHDCVTGNGVFRRMAEIITRDYNSQTQENDIAIIKVDQPFHFHLNKRLGPVCLPFPNQKSEDTYHECTIMGFGLTDKGTPSSDLLETTVNSMKFVDCQDAFKHEILQPISIDKQICTIGLHGSCHGDSGGPLIYKDPSLKRFVLEGVISWGPGNCTTHLPRVNTRTAFYMSWIEEVTNNEVCVVMKN